MKALFRAASAAATILFPSATGTAKNRSCPLYTLSWLLGGAVRYIPPFDLIRRSIEISTVKGELRISVPYEDFIDILKKILDGIEVDEHWYLQKYEDIADAIKKGSIKSAQDHFVGDGYFEGRVPFPMTVDEKWYLQEYRDVAENIAKGSVESAQTHFEENGYREGRLPFSK